MTTIVRLLDAAALIYVILIAIRALMAWLKPEVIYTYKKFFDFILAAVDQLLGLVRRVFPSNIGRVDLSPVIAIFMVETVKYIIIYFLTLVVRSGV